VSCPEVQGCKQLVVTSFQSFPHQYECLMSLSGINIVGAYVGLGDIVGVDVIGAKVNVVGLADGARVGFVGRKVGVSEGLLVGAGEGA
jgi:hypothetical protein